MVLTDAGHMAMTESAAHVQLLHLQAILEQVRTGQLHTAELVSVARACSETLSTLPEKYGRVLNDILDRLESGALFTEESCSFSQRDLLDSLALWIEKARNALGAAHTAL